MLKPLIFVCLLAIQLNAISQTGWVTKDLGSGISVKFPFEPVYKVAEADKAGSYRAKTVNNVFIAMVQYDAFPHYTEFLKLPDSEQSKLIDIFLNNTMIGLLRVDGDGNIPFTSIRIGNYTGREVSNTGINPLTGNSTKKFTKVFLVFNKLYVFQCIYLGDPADCVDEKNTFLNSISTPLSKPEELIKDFSPQIVWGYNKDGWVTKKVGADLSVKFPKEPNIDTKPERRLTLYTLKSDNSDCRFSVVRRNNAIPDYERIKNLPIKEQEVEVGAFLDKGITQFIQDSKIINPSKKIKIGGYIGREITYSQVDDTTGKNIYQFTRFFFADNDLYIIQCTMYTFDSCIDDKNIFLNSITSN